MFGKVLVFCVGVAGVLAGGAGQALSGERQPMTPGLFNSIEVATNPSREIPQWRRFRAKYNGEKAVYSLCDSGSSLCDAGLKEWREILAGARGKLSYDSLDDVNRGINGLVAYRNDDWVPGLKDRWASPLEAISNGGDCEDIAILKYVSLLELGVAEKDLRLVIVKMRRSQRSHAILTVRFHRNWVVLDNLEDMMLSASSATQYVPLYSISGSHRWLHLAYTRVSQSSQ